MPATRGNSQRLAEVHHLADRGRQRLSVKLCTKYSNKNGWTSKVRLHMPKSNLLNNILSIFHRTGGGLPSLSPAASLKDWHSAQWVAHGEGWWTTRPPRQHFSVWPEKGWTDLPLSICRKQQQTLLTIRAFHSVTANQSSTKEASFLYLPVCDMYSREVIGRPIYHYF